MIAFATMGSGGNADCALELTTKVVCAYVGANTVPAEALPKLLADIHAILSRLHLKTDLPLPEPQLPAVPIKKSVTQEHIICLEDGQKFKSLKRHLRTHYALTPQQYREKWGLPADYPMVAPAYSEIRSQLARSSGLGLATVDVALSRTRGVDVA